MVWTTIPDSDIDPDSPVTSALMTAYRDNFAAMANGDSGAPAILTAALVDGIVEHRHLPAFVAATTNYPAFSFDFSLEQATGTTPTKLKEFFIPCAGTISTVFTMVKSAGTGSPYGRVYKNGAAFGTLRSANGTYAETLTFAAGDYLQFYIWGSASGVVTDITDAGWRIDDTTVLPCYRS